MKNNGEHYLAELGDFNGTLRELKTKVDSLCREFGENSNIRVDAGYNNVEFIIKPFKQE